MPFILIQRCLHAQRSARQARCLLPCLVKIKHLSAQYWPSLTWGRFYKTWYCSIYTLLSVCVERILNFRSDISKLRDRQRAISLISEMYHTASLVHDDVIDRAEIRRGQESLNKRWGQRNAIWAGDFIVAISNKILGQLRDPLVSFLLFLLRGHSQIISYKILTLLNLYSPL